MREILFRGKTESSKRWVVGDLLQWSDGEMCICENRNHFEKDKYRVIPETVGQYTGLTDNNGNKIFEGDIVYAIYKSGYPGIPDKDFGIGIVRYNGTYYGGASYQIVMIGEPGCRVFSASLQVEVIGNIHDNPDFLKGERENDRA